DELLSFTWNRLVSIERAEFKRTGTILPREHVRNYAPSQLMRKTRPILNFFLAYHHPPSST
ncbi:hypothetical protein, partial [Acidisoma sp. S159]|uniref:hypothetical protein n=1 Tax=Acidisoma sp. S159 TaxID=1747225 RepID=UPI001C2098E6